MLLSKYFFLQLHKDMKNVQHGCDLTTGFPLSLAYSGTCASMVPASKLEYQEFSVDALNLALGMCAIYVYGEYQDNEWS